MSHGCLKSPSSITGRPELLALTMHFAPVFCSRKEAISSFWNLLGPMMHMSLSFKEAMDSFHGPLEGASASQHIVSPGPAIETELDLLHL